MQIIINNSSMIPIYEQIYSQIKMLIINEKLKSNDHLPSVRALANELKVSALTVKKAYDLLETEGYTTTIHGKGSYVLKPNINLIKDEVSKDIEARLQIIVEKAKLVKISNEELYSMLKIILED